MEGINIAALLLIYFGLFVVGITSLVALGLLVFRLTAAARILFGAGLLCAASIVAVGILWLFEHDFNQVSTTMMVVLSVLALLLAGTGQFIAALRGARNYAAALACAAASLAMLTAPMLSGDAGAQIPGMRYLAGLGLPLVGAGLLLAAGSLMIAVFLPFPERESASLGAARSGFSPSR